LRREQRTRLSQANARHRDFSIPSRRARRPSPKWRAGLLGRAFSKAELVLGPSASFYDGIASSAAAVYCLSSRKLAFLKDFWLVCGLLFGIAVCLVMN
jgi:4-amino-4-deoxy-L-arabinose transferase-like glycosyltransferase